MTPTLIDWIFLLSDDCRPMCWKRLGLYFILTFKRFVSHTLFKISFFCAEHANKWIKIYFRLVFNVSSFFLQPILPGCKQSLAKPRCAVSRRAEQTQTSWKCVRTREDRHIWTACLWIRDLSIQPSSSGSAPSHLRLVFLRECRFIPRSLSNLLYHLLTKKLKKVLFFFDKNSSNSIDKISL